MTLSSYVSNDQDVEWNIMLENGGPVLPLHNDSRLYPVKKGGKAVLKDLIMNSDQQPSTSATGTYMFVMLRIGFIKSRPN